MRRITIYFHIGATVQVSLMLFANVNLIYITVECVVRTTVFTNDLLSIKH